MEKGHRLEKGKEGEPRQVKRVLVSLPTAELEAARLRAQAEGRSLANLVRVTLRDYCRRREEEEARQTGPGVPHATRE